MIFQNTENLSVDVKGFLSISCQDNCNFLLQNMRNRDLAGSVELVFVFGQHLKSYIFEPLYLILS